MFKSPLTEGKNPPPSYGEGKGGGGGKRKRKKKGGADCRRTLLDFFVPRLEINLGGGRGGEKKKKRCSTSPSRRLRSGFPRHLNVGFQIPGPVSWGGRRGRGGGKKKLMDDVVAVGVTACFSLKAGRPRPEEGGEGGEGKKKRTTSACWQPSCTLVSP